MRDRPPTPDRPVRRRRSAHHSVPRTLEPEDDSCRSASVIKFGVGDLDPEDVEVRERVKIAKLATHTDVSAEEYDAAMALYPDNLELPFWYALGIYKAGNQKEALEIFKKLFAQDKVWYELIDRLPASDLLPAADVATIKAVGPGK